MRRAVLLVVVAACGEGERSRPAEPASVPAIKPGVELPLPPRRLPPSDDPRLAGMILIERHPDQVMTLPPGSPRGFIYSFYLDRTEVTVRAYRECVANGACPEPRLGETCTQKSGSWWIDGHDEHPINCIGAPDAHKFCVQLGKRLPTRPEWLYAAGTWARPYPWGDQEPRCETIAMFSERRKQCKAPRTRPVGTTAQDTSPFGVQDLAGNVSEFIVYREHEPPSAEWNKWGTMGGGIELGFNFDDGELIDTDLWFGVSPGAGFRCAIGPT